MSDVTVTKATIKIDLDKSRVIQGLNEIGKKFFQLQNNFNNSFNNIDNTNKLNEIQNKLNDFNKKQKTFLDSQNKTNDKLEHSFRNLNIQSTGFLSTLTKIVSALTLLTAGVSVFTAFNFGKDISFLSQKYQMLPEQISQMSNVSSVFGGNKKTFMQDFQNVQQSIDNYRLNKGGAFQDIAQRYGVNLTGAKDIQQVIDMIRQARKGGLGDAQTRDIINQLGITDRGNVSAIFSSDEEYKQQRERAYKMATITRESEQTVKNFNNALQELKSNLITVGINLMGTLTPYINTISNVFKSFSELNKHTQSLIVGGLIMLPVISKTINIMKGLFSTFQEIISISKTLTSGFMKLSPYLLLFLTTIQGVIWGLKTGKGWGRSNFNENVDKKGNYTGRKWVGDFQDWMLNKWNKITGWDDGTNNTITMPTSSSISNSSNINNTRNTTNNSSTNNNNYTINVYDKSTGNNLINMFKKTNNNLATTTM